MRYITITTWEVTEAADFDLVMDRVQEHRLPALKELGATRVQVIRTSDRTVAAITEWPDEATRDDAERMIGEVRQKVHAEDHSRMTGEMRGAVVAEV